MKRRAEPELMDEEEQARAYAEADFSEPHQNFVELFKKTFPQEVTGWVLDLGCGAADITLRFARSFTGCSLHGVDGSGAMLELGRRAVEAESMADRIELFCRRLPASELPRPAYDAIISNSLLHHLLDPLTLWRSAARFGRPGAPVFIMDLYRPQSEESARRLTETYAGEESDLLKRDFFNSLLAAYRPEEIAEQLKETGLEHFSIETVSDRHLVVHGHLE